MSTEADYYISGPMRGYPRYNFDAFLECEERLREMNEYPDHLVIHNPAQKDLDLGFDPDGGTEVTEAQMNEWMRRDLTDVAASQMIVLLPGWERSEGARRELAVAKWCGVRAYVYDPNDSWPLRRQTYDQLAEICNEADAERNAKVDQVLRDVYLDAIEEDVFRPNILTQLVSQKRLEPEDLPLSGEVRTTSSSGGQKGVKPERYDLLPYEALDEVARVFGFGALKYDDHNWRKGYEWSKSFAAVQRHMRAFWMGQDNDVDSGLSHLAHAICNAMFLLTWQLRARGVGDHFDDRVYVDHMLPEQPAA